MYDASNDPILVPQSFLLASSPPMEGLATRAKYGWPTSLVIAPKDGLLATTSSNMAIVFFYEHKQAKQGTFYAPVSPLPINESGYYCDSGATPITRTNALLFPIQLDQFCDLDKAHRFASKLGQLYDKYRAKAVPGVAELYFYSETCPPSIETTWCAHVVSEKKDDEPVVRLAGMVQDHEHPILPGAAPFDPPLLWAISRFMGNYTRGKILPMTTPGSPFGVFAKSDSGRSALLMPLSTKLVMPLSTNN